MDAAASRGRDFCFALFIGALLIGFVAFNAMPLWMRVDVYTDADDLAQVFYSPHAAWREEQSVFEGVRPQLTRTMFQLPRLSWMETVRLDPGRRAATYRILGVRWGRGFLDREIPLDAIASGRDGMPVALHDGQLQLTATDSDPQLIVPMPGPVWQAASFLFPTGLLVLGVAGMLVALWRRRLGLPAMATACVAIAALYYCAYLVQRGPHLPLNDDWRYVSPSIFNLFDGNWKWMLVAGNDTYFLTGQVLDFITLRLTNGNFEVLRWVALALLMLQLWLTLRVLARTATAIPPWLVTPAIVLVAWSLASNSYWGNAAIAYHQFLPTLCGSLLLVQLIGADGQLRTRFRRYAMDFICLAAGVAYISGGPMIFCLGLGFLLAQADVLRRDWRAPTLRGLWPVCRLALLLLGLQLILVTHAQGSLLDHTHASPSVLPNDHRFWLFACAQFGHALGYTGVSPLVDAGLTLIALVPTAILAWERIAQGFFRGMPAPRPALTAVALYAGIAATVYAAIVAFGRAGFAPPDAPLATVVEIAKGRFHYWPVAALLPFLWLGWVDVALRWRQYVPGAAIAIVALAMLVPKSAHTWDLFEYLRFPVTTTARGAFCIAGKMHEGPLEPFTCEAMTGVPMDLAAPMQQLRDHDMHLYRQIMRYEHAPLP